MTTKAETDDCEPECLADDGWRVDVDGNRSIIACHPSGWFARWTRSEGMWRGEAFQAAVPEAVTVRLGPVIDGPKAHESISAALAALPSLAARQFVRPAA